MTRAPFLITALASGHDRRCFSCGVVALDSYLRERVSQDIRRRVAACFVALSEDGGIAGYYTLATASVPLIDLPDSLRRKLPRYASVAAIRLGRLAVDCAFKGNGLGGALLADALHRSIASEIAAAVLIVDAKGDPAAAFYRHHDFIQLGGSPLHLFLPLTTAKSAI
ncbi:GNAT family N-acetyltransferase [Thiohalocapsa marina]|uniref:GNAT family N-acetyltransferase n=1 Tax=Thiohalocapsa marina TaxID=424902 RepID=A0A5M8FQ85_9GAMM|nr:GNAT family N-acetyltransferase [Thiohalocapsa marina]KAA6186200.1 GNAT family N-acetyltransferase [Thiohalocapsa marina]